MKRIFIIAGEPSGDYLGSKLIDDLNKLSEGQIEFTGIGGHLMSSRMNVFLDMSELTVIGIAEIIPKLFGIKKAINETVKKIIDLRPDVVITIDFSGFTHRVAKKVKKLVPGISIIHYVAPPIWAWRPWRAKKMNKFIDMLLTLFPFEPPLFEKFGLKSVFVGHPVASDNYLKKATKDEEKEFLEKYDLSSYETICFLPGSRDSELQNHVPIMNEVHENLKGKYRNIKIVIPTIPEKVDLLRSLLKIDSYQILTDLREKNLAMSVSRLAIAASGTVNLELAKIGTPAVVIYKTSFITAFFVRLLIRIKYFSIVNILAGKMVVPELIQDNCIPEKICSSIDELDRVQNIDFQKSEYRKVIDLVKEPEEMLAAKEVMAFMRRNSWK